MYNDAPSSALLMATPNRYQVISYGPGAFELLSRAGPWGYVLASFSRCFYLIGVDESVICVADKSLDEGPARLRIDFSGPPSLEVEIGAPAELRRGELYLGNRAVLRLSGAVPWSPRPVQSLAHPTVIRARIRNLVAALESEIPDAGLAPLVRCSTELALGMTVRPPVESNVARHALPAVEGLAAGLAAADEHRVHTGVQRLIGLGPGLTPSGDDLLAGSLVALTSVQAAGPSHSGSAARDLLANAVLRYAPNGATVISAAMLRNAALGVATSTVHRLLAALLETRPLVAPIQPARELVCTGHTSGWDSLAGLLLGVLSSSQRLECVSTTRTGKLPLIAVGESG